MIQPRLSIRLTPLRFRRGRSLTTRRAQPEAHFLAAMLARFRVRHETLLRRYERLVRRTDVLGGQRDILAGQIRALERAIAALEEYPRR